MTTERERFDPANLSMRASTFDDKVIEIFFFILELSSANPQFIHCARCAELVPSNHVGAWWRLGLAEMLYSVILSAARVPQAG